jgi:NAD(P)-dependent dehydrogenase (short-subunit alcohol dehydrogenase family)
MNILITGASKGIGFETAKHLASLGNHNIVAISRDENKLKELKSQCIRVNIEAHLYPIPFDLTVSESFTDILIGRINDFVPHIDILINNAGFLVNKPLETLSDSELNQILNVNFIAPARLIRAIVPIMKPGGHVVNISSMGGFQGSAKFSGLSVYSASKAAVANLTECLAVEYNEHGIAFNCLALGAVSTEMLNQAFPGYHAPLSASEMGAFISNFALTGNKFFNGKILPVSLSTP